MGTYKFVSSLVPILLVVRGNYFFEKNSMGLLGPLDISKV